MAVNPKNKEFDVRASIIVYKDGEQHKRLTVDNPVFYPTNKRSVVTIQSIPKQEQNIAFVSGLYCKETLGKELWHLKQITKYGSLNPDRSAKYRDALNYFGLTNIKDFITFHQGGKMILNLQIEIKTVSEDKSDPSVRGKPKQHMTTFRFRVVDGHPDHVESVSIGDWINLDPCGFCVAVPVEKDKPTEDKPTKTKVVKSEDKLREAMSKLTSLLADVYNLPSTDSITLSIKIDKSK